MGCEGPSLGPGFVLEASQAQRSASDSLLYARVSSRAPQTGAEVTRCKACEGFPPLQRTLVRITRSPLQTENGMIPEPPCLVFKMKLFEKATSLVKTEKPTGSQALKPLGRVCGLGT